MDTLQTVAKTVANAVVNDSLGIVLFVALVSAIAYVAGVRHRYGGE
jgi:hypothetical protein